MQLRCIWYAILYPSVGLGGAASDVATTWQVYCSKWPVNAVPQSVLDGYFDATCEGKARRAVVGGSSGTSGDHCFVCLPQGQVCLGFVLPDTAIRAPQPNQMQPLGLAVMLCGFGVA